MSRHIDPDWAFPGMAPMGHYSADRRLTGLLLVGTRVAGRALLGELRGRGAWVPPGAGAGLALRRPGTVCWRWPPAPASAPCSAWGRQSRSPPPPGPRFRASGGTRPDGYPRVAAMYPRRVCVLVSLSAGFALGADRPAVSGATHGFGMLSQWSF